MAGRWLRRGCDLRVCFAVMGTWASSGCWLQDGQYEEYDGKIQNAKLPSLEITNFEIPNFKIQEGGRGTGESTETCGWCGQRQRAFHLAGEISFDIARRSECAP